MAAKVSLSKIRQVALPVNDIAEATRFYRDTLGMRHLFDAPPGLSFFDCGGVQLMLAGPDAQGKDGGEEHAVPFYHVTDIRGVPGRIKTSGAKSIEEPRAIGPTKGREIWGSSFNDGQGNVVSLM